MACSKLSKQRHAGSPWSGGKDSGMYVQMGLLHTKCLNGQLQRPPADEDEEYVWDVYDAIAQNRMPKWVTEVRHNSTCCLGHEQVQKYSRVTCWGCAGR